MVWELKDGVWLLELNLITSSALVILLLMFGEWARKKFSIFRQYCIPAAVVGGFGFAIFVFLLREMNVLQITFDRTLSDLFMFAFFATIGLGTSFDLLKKGGRVLLYYVFVCWALAFVQNGIGVGSALLLGIDPLLGIASGAVALEGGHGMAAAMGPFIEESGGTGALTIGLAAATYGLVSGSLIGGPVGNWLIKRHKVKIETDQGDWDKFTEHLEAGEKEEKVTAQSILQMVAVIFTILAIGTTTAKWITEATGFTVPGHVFSLFLGVVFRSFNDRKPVVAMRFKSVDVISLISLELFLTMAMMNLKLWELYDLALPLIIMLVVQTIATVLIAIFVIFRVTGKNYDAALLASGFIGHGLGATANGLAVMDAVSSKYGLVSKKAFFIIPVAGSMLIDIVGVPAIVLFTNWFAH